MARNADTKTKYVRFDRLRVILIPERGAADPDDLPDVSRGTQIETVKKVGGELLDGETLCSRKEFR